MHIKRGVHRFSQIDKLGIVSLFSLIGLACVSTIWAIYLESFVHNQSTVGFITTLFTIVSLIAFLALTPIIEKKRKTWLYGLSLILYLLAYILFSLSTKFYFVLFLGLVISVVASLRTLSFGIIVCDKSNKRNLSRDEGKIYTFFNIAYLMGPLLAGFVSAKFGLASVFSLASVFIFLSISLFYILRIVDAKIPRETDGKVLKTFWEYFKDKNRRRGYIISGGVSFWWAFIYIFMPMYIVDSGFSTIIVGYFVAAVTIPLILFEYPFSKLINKKGFKKIFFMGYLITGSFALLCFFSNTLYVILILIVLASVGCAMIEPSAETYFFRLISEKERDKYYGSYKTSITVFNAFATLLGAIVLLILPFKFLFVFFAGVMIFLALSALRINEKI